MMLIGIAIGFVVAMVYSQWQTLRAVMAKEPVVMVEATGSSTGVEVVVNSSLAYERPLLLGQMSMDATEEVLVTAYKQLTDLMPKGRYRATTIVRFRFTKYPENS